MNLTDLQVVVLDCQTTGSRAGVDRLLEMAWLPARASAPAGAAVSFFLCQPPGTSLSRRISRITGIEAAALQGAPAPQDVWRQLADTCRAVAAEQPRWGCPLVIHYARFETGFLARLARDCGAADDLLRGVICTHEIACRLLPWLPRKGLRAVAGYFGCSLPVAKRAGGHAEATAAVWRKLVELLADDGIESLNALRQWLRRPRPVVSRRRQYPMPASPRRGLPSGPGVYRMLRSNGDVLYIGKAKSLRKRVGSYFQPGRRHGESILEMLSQAVDLRATPTETALEAALLEADEIKRRRPPYNQALRAGERRLWFCSRDFTGFVAAADPVCRLGPLAYRRRYRALHRLGRYLLVAGHARRLSLQSRLELLALPDARHCPDERCLQEGLQRFRQCYADACHRQTPWRALVAVGARIWRQRSVAAETREETDSAVPEGWDAAAVLHHLETLLMVCAHGLRRARWITLLCDASLAWNRADDGGWRVLVFRRGRIDHCSRAPAAAVPPLPPGWRRSRLQRQQCLDLRCYDRLRVFTTELRRLTAEGRRLQLRIGTGVVLDADRVARVLNWV